MKISNHLLESCEVVSFDIFDTTLLRTVKTPRNIFYFVGENISKYRRIAPEQFVCLRIFSEKACRFFYRYVLGKEEVKLNTIYSVLCKLLILPPKYISLLVKEELDEEEKNIVLNSEVVELIQSIKLLDKRIIFTSDMYLPFDFLYNLLKRKKIVENENQLYLSSAVGKRKRFGSLYKHVLRKENLSADKLLHIGDDYEHDVEVPKKMGIQALHYDRTYSDAPWMSAIGSSEVYRGIISQTSDKTFIKAAQLTSDRVLNQFNSYIAGPLLFSFVYWILKEAVDSKIETLYFLARDGQILSKIASIIKTKQDLPVEIRYLYASRHSWLLPSLFNYEELEKQDALFKFSKKLTLDMLFHRFKISDIPEELKLGWAHKLGLGLNEKLTVANLQRAKSLFSELQVIDLVEQRARRDFAALTDYLKKEKVFNTNSFAIVDTGWRGTLPTALRRIFLKNDINNKKFTAFYFDLYGRPKYADIDNFRSFLKETKNQYKKSLRGELEIIMELFTASTHESTFGFKNTHDNIKIVFIKENLDRIFKWGIREQHEIICQFAECLIDHQNFGRIPLKELYRIPAENFYAFLNNPTYETAVKISRFPYNVQQVKISKEYNVICAPYRFGDFKTLIQSKNPMRPNDLWIQGSLALTRHYLTRLCFKYFYKCISLPPVRWLERQIVSLIN